MIYVISDLHGYPFEDFLALLEKAEFSDSDTLYVLGDVVDRGADGVKYLLWLMEQKNAVLLLGNHELMMRKCDFLFKPDAYELTKNLKSTARIDLSLWMSNGAEPTVRGLFEASRDEREAILEYLNSLPLYKRLEVGGRKYLLVHSGMRDFDPQKELDDYPVEDMVWNRPALDDRYFDDVTTVFGHTPTFFYGVEHEGKLIITDTWIDIDAGAARALPPILLRLDDMKTFQ